jgi:hypothetical protein
VADGVLDYALLAIAAMATFNLVALLVEDLWKFLIKKPD